jgi:hypothetical protein
MILNQLIKNSHTGMSLDTLETPSITTGIHPNTRKMILFTTSTRAYTRETVVFTTGNTGIAGVNLDQGKSLNKETPCPVGQRVLIKLGTDLLSHVLPQYHRLWRA